MPTFKAGTYYIGDPCYVVNPHSEWIRLLNRTNFLENGEFKYKGQQCYADSTAHGDGGYKDNLGNRYSVDAGLLGIMPMSIIKLDKKECKRLGNIIKFDKDFEVDSYGGIFIFGHITINTR